MGINFALVDEHGEVAQPGGILLGDDLPSFDDSTYPYLRLIDPYGDTTFGRQQMVAVLPELERWVKECPSDAVSKLLELAEACSRKPHTYIKLIGD